jgi:ABC-type proline/glycine betaine transport system permease subunit
MCTGIGCEQREMKRQVEQMHDMKQMMHGIRKVSVFESTRAATPSK